MSARLIVTILTTASLTLALTNTAGAHYKTGNPDDPSSLWYFKGETWTSDGRTVRDPVNFMFLPGAADTSLYTRTRIEQHMDDDWDRRVVGGRRWKHDGEVNFYCKDDQRMFWEGYPGETSDKTDWHGSTARLGGVCGNQHHARFWDDQEHARAHCAVARWRYHPGADNQFQGFDNSGFIARFSLHHVSDGGCSGQ